MADQLAKDYAKFFKKNDISKEINPLCSSIEEMMARLEEFENLLVTVKIDSNTAIQQNVPQILNQKADFDELCERIDGLERFVAMVSENLNSVEQTVVIAEEELGVADYSLKGLFKPFFHKSKIHNKPQTNVKNGEFEKPRFFKTDEFFSKEVENKS